MATVVRNVGYTGGLQTLTWTAGQSTIQAYLWGAGGGGGGDEGSDDPGGNGGGGGFAQYNFTINPGDVLTVAVGQGGGGGVNTPGQIAGVGGRSLAYSVFDSRTQSGVVPVSDPRWNYFMNAHAVWDPGGSGVSPIFRSYSVNFPVSGYYVFQYSADDGMSVDLDDTTIINYGGFSADPVPFVSQYVTSGNHTLNISANNAGGDVAGFALTIDISFSGANGGTGTGGSNGGGSGGGGGGATVLLLNNAVLAVAGGGAGGGGAGDIRWELSPNAPGPWGWPAGDVPLAQDGQSTLPGVGAGGGGGGGGQNAGNGGRWGGASPANPSALGDYDATAGSYGISAGSPIGVPDGRIPGNTSNQYYSGSSVGGYGGSRWPSNDGQPGLNGMAAIVMDVAAGFYVKDENLWKLVNTVYIKDAGVWKPVTDAYVNDGGTWQSVYTTNPPTFSVASGGFAQISRRRGQG